MKYSLNHDYDFVAPFNFFSKELWLQKGKSPFYIWPLFTLEDFENVEIENKPVKMFYQIILSFIKPPKKLIDFFHAIKRFYLFPL